MGVIPCIRVLDTEISEPAEPSRNFAIILGNPYFEISHLGNIFIQAIVIINAIALPNIEQDTNLPMQTLYYEQPP